jgi:hypothetical protein
VDLGDTLTFKSDLYDKPTEQGGVLINATAASLTVTLPDGTTATPVVTNPPTVTGKYTSTYVAVSQSGRYVGRWLFTLPGGNTTAYVETFDVGQGLVTVDEAVAHLRAAGIVTSSADLDQLQWLCMVATDAVERDLGRALTRRTVTEVYDGGRPEIILRQSPVISITSVTDSLVSLAASGYTLDQSNGILYRGSTSTYWTPFTYGRQSVSVTYVAGYLDPPRAARMVALTIVQSLWQESQQAGHPLIDESAGVDLFAAVGSLNSYLQRAYDSLRAPAIA